MKNIYLSLGLCLGVLGAANAQKLTGKEIDSRYIQLPAYDLSQVDPMTITAEFACGDHVFGKEQVGDYESICKPKGGTLKDAVKITTYHYVVSTTQPESFLIAKDASGNILFGAQLSSNGPSTAKFGYDKCEYWIADKMKKDYESGKTGFQNSTNSNFAGERYKEAMNLAFNNVFISYVEESFELNKAKGKGFDYSDLDGAYDKAAAAYASYKTKGPNQADMDALQGAIDVWKKALEEADLENKKSRINKPIARGLHENIANAYMYMYKMDDALKHAREVLKLWGNTTTNRTTAWKARVEIIEAREIAAQSNAGIISDHAALIAKADASKSNKISVQKHGADQVPRIKQDFSKYQTEVLKADMDARKEEYDAAVASGDVNKYDKYCTATAGGKVLNLTQTMAKMQGDADITEFPTEVCAMGEDLKQANITGFSFTNVAPCIGQLTNCTRLSLANTKVESIPAEIGQMSSLKTLVLTNCPITTLPEEIKNCSELKTLNLKGTKLSSDEQKKVQGWLPDCKIKF